MLQGVAGVSTETTDVQNEDNQPQTSVSTYTHTLVEILFVNLVLTMSQHSQALSCNGFREFTGAVSAFTPTFGESIHFVSPLVGS